MANVFSYYSFDKVLSYNAVYNFVIGARGLGKTFGAKKKAINDYLNKGWQFIYLRRYKDEVKDVRSSFFADIAHFYPDVQFRVKGKEAQITWDIDAEDKSKEWHVIGYFLCLLCDIGCRFGRCDVQYLAPGHDFQHVLYSVCQGLLGIQVGVEQGSALFHTIFVGCFAHITNIAISCYFLLYL